MIITFDIERHDKHINFSIGLFIFYCSTKRVNKKFKMSSLHSLLYRDSLFQGCPDEGGDLYNTSYVNEHFGKGKPFDNICSIQFPTNTNDVPNFIKKSFVTRPTVLQSLMSSDRFKTKFLEKYPMFRGIQWDGICVAGGAVCSILHDTPTSDVDVFMYNNNGNKTDMSIRIQMFLEHITKYFCAWKCDYTVKKGGCVVTLENTTSTHSEKFKIQLITVNYKSISHILHEFDTYVSAVAFTGNDVFYTVLSAYCNLNKCNIVSHSKMTRSYIGRLQKYFDRGFKLIIPAVKNASIKDEANVTFRHFTLTNVVNFATGHYWCDSLENTFVLMNKTKNNPSSLYHSYDLKEFNCLKFDCNSKYDFINYLLTLNVTFEDLEKKQMFSLFNTVCWKGSPTTAELMNPLKFLVYDLNILIYDKRKYIGMNSLVEMDPVLLTTLLNYFRNQKGRYDNDAQFENAMHDKMKNLSSLLKKLKNEYAKHVAIDKVYDPSTVFEKMEITASDFYGAVFLDS